MGNQATGDKNQGEPDYKMGFIAGDEVNTNNKTPGVEQSATQPNTRQVAPVRQTRQKNKDENPQEFEEDASDPGQDQGNFQGGTHLNYIQ